MAAELLNSALVSFLDDLSRIERLVELTKILREFGDETPSAIEEDKFIASAVHLKHEVKNSSTLFPVLSGTLLLYVSGRFENFVRTTFEALCDIYASKCTKFSELPEKMQTELVAFTAMVMPNPKKYGFDSIQTGIFIQNMSNNISDKTESGEDKITLGEVNSKCLSITETNMNSDMVHKIFARIGITTIWQDVGKQASLKVHFETNTDNEVVTKAKKVLDDIMGIRNKIAHPSGEPEFPDATAVLKNIEYLKLLSTEIVSCCNVQVASFKPVTK